MIISKSKAVLLSRHFEKEEKFITDKNVHNLTKTYMIFFKHYRSCDVILRKAK